MSGRGVGSQGGEVGCHGGGDCDDGRSAGIEAEGGGGGSREGRGGRVAVGHSVS